MDVLRYDALNDEVVIEQILPCITQGRLETPLDFVLTGEFLVQLHWGGKLTIFRLGSENIEPNELLLGGETEMGGKGALLPNVNLPQLLAAVAEDEFWVINLNSMRLLQHGRGAFSWREFDQYFTIVPDCIRLHSLSSEEPLLVIPSQHHWREISFNAQKNLYSLFSPQEKLIHVPLPPLRSTPSKA